MSINGEGCGSVIVERKRNFGNSKLFGFMKKKGKNREKEKGKKIKLKGYFP